MAAMRQRGGSGAGVLTVPDKSAILQIKEALNQCFSHVTICVLKGDCPLCESNGSFY